MAPQLSYRYVLLLAGGWLASVAIAFSLGKIGPTDESPTGLALSTNGSAETLGSSERAVASTGAAGPGKTEKVGAETLQQVTGGEPLEDWMKRLAGLDDEILRTESFLRLLSVLNTPEELEAALKALKAAGEGDRFRGGFGFREGSMLLQKLTQLDPKRAMAFARSADGQRDRWFGASVVMGTWARVNPDEALAHAQSNPLSSGNDDGNWALASVVAQFAKSDLDRALQIASTQEGESRARGMMIESILSEMISQRGNEAARAAVMSLPEGTFRDNIAAQLARKLADKDGPGTAQWVVSSLPQGPVRNNALASTISQWVRNDAVAAGEFLARFPPSPDVDAARERYAYGVVNTDPESALAWAGTITSDDQRARTVEGLINGWMRRDRTAAQKWVASAELPGDLKAKFLRN